MQRIALWYKLGYGPEEMVRKYPHLTLAHVHAALAYYHANQAEIEAGIAADEAEYERLERNMSQRDNLPDEDSTLSR